MTVVEQGQGEMLHKIASSGADNAAKALSIMLGSPVTIDISKIHIMAPELIQSLYDKPDQVTIGLFMDLPAEYMDFVLALERGEGVRLAQLILTMGPDDDPSPELLEDALKEMANIIIGSFVTAISDSLGQKIVPTPPQMSVDFFDSLLSQFLIKQTLFTDTSIVFETTFKRDGEDINANLIVLGGRQMFGDILDDSPQ
ncbi:MAG: chemotaxis protein CheC [Candidatus Bathyarchaeota archaeon]|nr:chemotaxis protein CheC [Candidatus Bathyarchaeota archaeon]